MCDSLLAQAAGAAGRGPRLNGSWECRTRSRSCLDQADQGVRTFACAHATERPTGRRSSAEAVARRRGVDCAAPQQPQYWFRPDNLAGSGRPAQPAAPAPLEPPGSHRGGGASVRSPADHRPFTRSAARSFVDHPRPGGAAGLNDGTPTGHIRRWPAASIPNTGKGAACGTPSSTPLGSLQPLEARRQPHLQS
jgi:hypothetical protein